MTEQNRVTPFGTIEALPGRGTFMGNRGCIHEGHMIKRQHASKAWITCVLEFKGWRAPMWEPNRWTPLFFLDEATSFAAGHRPCALCRRADHKRFRAAWGETPLKEIDATLHAERRGERTVVPGDGLVDGSMVTFDDGAWLKLGDTVRPWTNEGYGAPQPVPDAVTLLTPPSTVATISNGYAPAIHESAR